MRKFADKQRTDKKRTRWNSNTETTLSLSSVDTRGSWPICQKIFFQDNSLKTHKKIDTGAKNCGILKKQTFLKILPIHISNK